MCMGETTPVVQNVPPNNTDTYAHVLLVSIGQQYCIRYMLHLTNLCALQGV